LTAPRPPAAAIDAFVGDMAAAFGRAAAASGCDERTLRLAGRTIRVASAGAELADAYLAALAHLETPRRSNDAADLTVHLWERATTGIAPPPPPWSADDFLAGGRIRGHANDDIRATYAGWARTLTVYDATRAHAYVHLADRREVPPWVLRAPLRNVLTWWASDLGFAFLHAAAVADERSAVVLAGPSGSGKSTTALACLADGLSLLGDDACIVEVSGAPVVHSVYGFAKLERDALLRIPELEDFVVDPNADQLLVQPRHMPVSAIPLRAVLVPNIVPRAETALCDVPARDAWRVIVPASVMEGDGAGGTTLPAITRLVLSTACRRIDLGSRRADVVAAVRQALRGE
jgi:hypothetical protein